MTQLQAAIITGGGSGIGRATARAFGMRGVAVIVNDISASAAEQTAELVRSSGGDALAVPGSVADPDIIPALVDAALSAYGRVDYLHNNAATEGAVGLPHEYPQEEWDRIVATNVTSVFRAIQHVVPPMLRQGSGAIVNTASALGLVGNRGQAAYTASKHAVVGLTKAVALDYADKGIRINAVCPGLIDTPMFRRLVNHDEEAIARYVGAQPIGRLGLAEEVAAAVVWLCSPEASLITGVALPVDGGYVAQ